MIVAVIVEGELFQDGIVESAVGGVRASSVRPGAALEISKLPARLGDYDRACRHVVQLELRLTGDVDTTLGEEHVGPEVPIGTCPPAPSQQVDELLALAGLDPRR